jgi:hypothetical protein
VAEEWSGALSVDQLSRDDWSEEPRQVRGGRNIGVQSWLQRALLLTVRAHKSRDGVRLEIRLWTFGPVEDLVRVVAGLGFRGKVTLYVFSAAYPSTSVPSAGSLLESPTPFGIATSQGGIGVPKCRAEAKIETSAFDARFPAVAWTSKPPLKLWWAMMRLADQVEGPYFRRQRRSPSVLTISLEAKSDGESAEAAMRWIADRLPEVLSGVTSSIFGAGAINRFGDPLALPFRQGITIADSPERDRTFDRIQAVMVLPSDLAGEVRVSSSDWIEHTGATHTVFVAREPPSVPGGDMSMEGWERILASRDRQEESLPEQIAIEIPGGGAWHIRFDDCSDHPLHAQHLAVLEMESAVEVDLLTPYGARAVGIAPRNVPRIMLPRALGTKVSLALEERLRGNEGSLSARVHLDAAIEALQSGGLAVKDEDATRFKQVAERLAVKH